MTPGAETWKWLGDVEDLGPGRGQEKAWTRYQGWPGGGQNETRRRQEARTWPCPETRKRLGRGQDWRPGTGQDEDKTRPERDQDKARTRDPEVAKTRPGPETRDEEAKTRNQKEPPPSRPG
jgi:hypothetical protein